MRYRRSGDFFAFEKSKVRPDIVPIAKGIGGGFPIGAVLMNKKVVCTFPELTVQHLVEIL